MENYKYRVSVIVPVYNGEEYLETCLNSLLAQTMPLNDFEVLLINDGSIDSSEEICRYYVNNFENFKLISKDNEGLSATRNLGLKTAKGKYITFLDCDDTYSNETLKNVCDFFDKHYNEIDEVTFPIVRYKNGSTLPLHYRYKYLTKTGIYDLKQTPFVSQSNINICVKNFDQLHILFDTTPNFRHEDQAFNSEVLSRKMKIGFVKEAEYKYNRDNDSSIISTYMYAYYIFETTTQYWESVFGQYDDAVPQYYQVQFFNDIVWKFAEHRLWPYHYDEEEFRKARNRIAALLNRVDNEVIMQYPNADNYQKLYWIRQKTNCSIIPIFSKDCINIIADGKSLYRRSDVEIILKRVVVHENYVKIVGFYKSPCFAFIEKPECFYYENHDKRVNIDVTIASASYHRAKEQTDKFWAFEVEIPVYENDNKSIDFGIVIDGIEYPIAFYNTISVPFYKATMPKFSKGNIVVEQSGNSLHFAHVNSEAAKKIRFDNHNKFKNNADLYTIRLSTESYLGKRIWLYYDNYTVSFDNGYLQFLHDIEMNDGVERYYVIDSHNESLKSESFTEEISKHFVQYGSFKHKILYLASEKILTSFIEHFSISPFDQGTESKCRDLFHAELIYLQHGILHAHLPWYYTPIGVEVDKVIASSEYEVENFTANYGFKKENVLLFGQARYDIMDKNSKGKNKVIFAPSWRSYLIGEPSEVGGLREGDSNKLEASNYFKNIMSFVNDEELLQNLEQNDVYLELKLHPNFYQMYKSSLAFNSNRIRIAENKVDLCEYSMFITDFSSFVFDYGYLNRPILYFIPDYDEFKSGMNRYRELDLPLDKAFGKLAVTPKDAVHEVVRIINQNFKVDDVFYKRMDEFYIEMGKNRHNLYNYLISNS